jgi:glutathione S-transferase
MKLYSAPLSLFARKVEIALHEKALPFERVMVPFNQREGYAPKHPDVIAANPKSQVPVLVDQGLALYDSTVILEYLEDAYPQPPLYPRTPQARARCRLLEVFADEVMLIPLKTLMHRTGPRPDDPARWIASEAAAALATPAIESQFRYLDQQLQGQTFLCGTFSIADISVFMAVLYVQRLGGPGVETGGDALVRWMETLQHRPAFASVTSEIAAADVELSEPVARA